MAIAFPTERVYSSADINAAAALVACSMLSFICVSGVLLILGVSAVRSRRSSNERSFIRTQVAIYFVSLLICNFAQAIGGLLNIIWLVEDRVYIGVACTAQAVIKQIGNAGPAIFSFVIAIHTLSVLFLERTWSNRTCYVVLIVSWSLLLFVLCIGNFILSDPEKGPFYGISSSGNWCWIAPSYQIARYTTDYLFMIASAASSFIFYSLAFFRLRGNITVEGNKIRFHCTPKVGDGGMSNEAVGSYLTTVAKHMMWYPIVYAILVLPVAISRLSTYSGVPVPFSVTIFTVAVFMLHGFLNTVLFCTTRTILPGNWRQRFGLSAGLEGGRGDVRDFSRTNAMSLFFSTRSAAVDKGSAPATRSADEEKGVEIKYETEPNPSDIGSSTPSTSPIPPPQAHRDAGKEVGTHEHHIQQLPFSTPRDTRRSIHPEVEGDDEGSDYGEVVSLADTEGTVEREALQHPGRASSEYDNGMVD